MHSVARPGEVFCLIGDATLARSFGWAPRCSFASGLYSCLGKTEIYPAEED